MTPEQTHQRRRQFLGPILAPSPSQNQESRVGVKGGIAIELPKSWWPGPGSSRRPSAFQAEAKSEARHLCWSNWTNWTHLEGSEHAVRAAGGAERMKTNP